MKKILSVMLAVIVLALPCVSMANEQVDLLMLQKALQTTITFSDANLLPLVGDEQTAAVINELINVVGLRCTVQQADAESMQANMAFTLSGADAFKADVMMNKTGMYLASNMLGQDVLSFDYQKMMDMFQDMKDQMIEEGVSEAQLSQMIDMLKKMQSGEYFNQAMVKNDLDDMQLTNTTAVLEKLLAKAQPADVATAPEGCDTPASAATLTLTGKEAAELMNAMLTDFGATKFGGAYLSSLESSLASFGENAMTLDDMIQKISEVYENDIVYTFYFNAEGEAVAVTVACTLNDSDKTDVKMVILFKAEGEKKTVTLNMDLTGAQKMNILFTLTEESENNVAFDCTVSEGDTADVRVYGTVVEAEENDVDHVTVDVYVTVPAEGPEAGVRVLVDVMANDDDITGTTLIKILPLSGEAPYVTLSVVCELVDMLPAVSTENTVDILSMSDEEIQAWTESITSSAQLELIKMIQMLPPSVLSLVMGM